VVQPQDLAATAEGPRSEVRTGVLNVGHLQAATEDLFNDVVSAEAVGQALRGQPLPVSSLHPLHTSRGGATGSVNLNCPV
jgi:hypothetical protein